MPPKISIVVLTYNRLAMLEKLLAELQALAYRPLEVIVVDNASSEGNPAELAGRFPQTVFLCLEANLGAVGRNRGLARATGEIVITLDDDIAGLSDGHLRELVRQFARPQLGAACFKVVDPQRHQVVNWCHHYPVEEYSERGFPTNEITEGAVAFRAAALQAAGLYPESFFISHEGPDLACRLIDRGYQVRYCPEIVVEHHHSPAGRKSWRRYYYDVRNLPWLAIRNFPLGYGLRLTGRGLAALLVYSLRDGFFRYWLKAVIDSVRGMPAAWRQRVPVSAGTMAQIREIESHRPGFFQLARKRLLSREIRI